MKSFNTLFLSAPLFLLTSHLSADSGYFGCDQYGNNCSLKKSEVPGTVAVFENEPYHAEFLINYDFACPPYTMESQIVLSAGDQTQINLMYNASEKLRSVTGYGPVRLRDTDPALTLTDTSTSTCNLSIEATMKPSSQTIQQWLTISNNLKDKMLSEIYFLRSKIQVINYLDLYIASEGSSDVRGLINNEINDLLLEPTTDEKKTIAATLQQLLAGELNSEQILQSYTDSSQRLINLIAESKKHVRKLKFAQLQEEALLASALTEAETKL